MEQAMTKKQLLQEMNENLKEIKDAVQFQSKLFEELYMRADEDAKKKKDVMQVPFLVMKQVFEKLIENVPEERREEMERLLNTFESFAAGGR